MRMHARIAIEGRTVRIARWMRERRRASQRSANICVERALLADLRALTERALNRARVLLQIIIRASAANLARALSERACELQRRSVCRTTGGELSRVADSQRHVFAGQHVDARCALAHRAIEVLADAEVPCIVRRSLEHRFDAERMAVDEAIEAETRIPACQCTADRGLEAQLQRRPDIDEVPFRIAHQ